MKKSVKAVIMTSTRLLDRSSSMDIVSNKQAAMAGGDHAQADRGFRSDSRAVQALELAMSRIQALDITASHKAISRSDVAWSPEVPIGHSSFTWTGVPGLDKLPMVESFPVPGS